MTKGGQTSAFFPLGGGMDLKTPPIAKPPGRVIAALNYEPVAAGYRRLRGYERFNGQTAPSDAKAYLATYDANGGGNSIYQFLIGEEVRRNSDNVTLGYVASSATLVSGTWGTSSAVGQMLVWITDAKLSEWTDNLQVKRALATAVFLNGTPTLQTAIASQQLAATQARALITAVPGSGALRGVWYYAGVVLAVRDNAGATAGVFYKSTTTGWTSVSLAKRLNFTSGGTYEVVVGNEIVGATSAATGVVAAIILSSGSWAGGDAAGYFLVQSQSGTYQAENLNVDANLNVATIAADTIAVTLPAGGRYKFINHNFYGAADRECMYGVNGVGYAFEYDGTTINVAIVTGTAADTPHSIAAHRMSLFLGYEGGSIQFSQVGEPLLYDAALGAGEIAIGDEIVDFIAANSGTLAIFGESSVSVLYGNDATDYVLETLTRDAGALEHTAQKFGQVVYMDNGGIRTLSTSAAFGDFTFSSLSQLIQPLLEDYRRDAVNPVASLVSRNKGQYWIFFSNDTAISTFMGAKQPSILPSNLGFTVSCCCSVEINGQERMFLGSDDGFVYELDKGTSFDGATIEHYVALPYNHFGAPQQLKRFHRADVELITSGTTTVTAATRLDGGGAEGVAAQTLDLTVGGSAVDDLGSNEEYYASQIGTTGKLYIEAVASDISLKIGGSQSTQEPHTLTGITFWISPRGMKR